MKIQALMENTAGAQDILIEHGLSLYIETGRHKILFDSGQSAKFAENAERMGVDLGAVDLMILSHGHYDHGGGLHRFLELNDKAPIYVSRYAFEPHWHRERYIGIDPALKDDPRIVFVGDELDLGDGLKLYSANSWPCTVDIDSAGLSMEEKGERLPDDFRHEQYLLVEEQGKKILFSGCSHKGILNIETWFRPDVLIGGFHFMTLDPAGPGRETLQKNAELLQNFPTKYWTCHCTGTAQYTLLKEIMGEQLGYLAAGQTLCI